MKLPKSHLVALWVTPVARQVCQTDVAVEVLLSDTSALLLVEAVYSKHSAAVAEDRSDVMEPGASIHCEAYLFD